MGEAFSKLPFDHLVFTGSTRVGKIVMHAASENLVPVTLELGGKSPTIVGERLPHEDRGATASWLARRFNAGQTCIAPDYVLVPAGRATLRRRVQGGGREDVPGAREEPGLHERRQPAALQRLSGYVDDAKTRGAKVVEINPAGGAPRGDAQDGPDARNRPDRKMR